VLWALQNGFQYDTGRILDASLRVRPAVGSVPRP
jgi:hypothetical protein